MKTLDSLKQREMALAARAVKALEFLKKIEVYINAKIKAATEKLRDELVAQKVLRDDRLAYLALEAEKIKSEIAELGEAIVKHNENLGGM